MSGGAGPVTAATAVAAVRQTVIRGDILSMLSSGAGELCPDCVFVPVKMSEVGQSGSHCSGYTGSHNSVPCISLRVTHQKRNSSLRIKCQKLLVTEKKRYFSALKECSVTFCLFTMKKSYSNEEDN